MKLATYTKAVLTMIAIMLISTAKANAQGSEQGGKKDTAATAKQNHPAVEGDAIKNNLDGTLTDKKTGIMWGKRQRRRQACSNELARCGQVLQWPEASGTFRLDPAEEGPVGLLME